MRWPLAQKKRQPNGATPQCSGSHDFFCTFGLTLTMTRSWVGTDSQPHDGDAYLAIRGPPRMSPGQVVEGGLGRGAQRSRGPRHKQLLHGGSTHSPPAPAAFFGPPAFGGVHSGTMGPNARKACEFQPRQSPCSVWQPCWALTGPPSPQQRPLSHGRRPSPTANDH